MFKDDEVLNPLPQTIHTCGFSPEIFFRLQFRTFCSVRFVYLPVCVLICLLRREGLSKALLQTPQGSNVLSLGRALGVVIIFSGKSPCELAAELSPDTDFLSSSFDGGELLRALERRDIERSRGESETNRKISNVGWKKM